MSLHVDSLRRILKDVLPFDHNLYVEAVSYELLLCFDYQGYWMQWPMRRLLAPPYARELAAEAMEFHEQLLWMRDGTGPIWG